MAAALRVPGEFAFASGGVLLVRFFKVDGDPGWAPAQAAPDKDEGGEAARFAREHLETRFLATTRAFDLRRLDRVTVLIDDVLAGAGGPAGQPPESEAYIDAIRTRLDDIAKLPPQVPAWAKDWLVLPLISCGMAAMFYNGPWISCVLALPLGYVQSIVKHAINGGNPVLSHLYGFLTAAVVGLLSGCIVGSGTFANQGVCFGTIGLAGVVWCIPGIPLVLSTMQLASADVSMGTSNLAFAILTVFLLGFGLEFGLELSLLFDLPAKPQPNCVPAQVNGFWFFLLFPLIGILHCMALEVHWPLGYLVTVPPAGLAFGAWYALQLIPSINNAGVTGFGFVLMVASAAACLPAFIYARLTRHSAFPIVYMAFQFIVPGGLSLKQALSDFGSAAGFTGGEFAAKVLAGALGTTVGAFLAHAAVWPRVGNGGWKPEPYR
ncbi:hypothetical protein DFJ74DRAFT_654698 [Hyaloraphidium curvatum]|nr:hypothetical protein DFJ74DRAFT_654698 [Hyaloraphidium curvatum]